MADTLAPPPPTGTLKQPLSTGSLGPPSPSSPASLGPPSSTGSLGVRERMLNYEASLRQPVAEQPSPRPRSSTQTSLPADRFRGARSSSGETGHTRRHWTLASISEQRVLKAGVRCLCERLAGTEAELSELPKRRDGQPAVMQASFIRRLLGDQLELKVCSQADVSAAQPDLRHLTTWQLLTLRARTLDFSTDSESHSAHRNFLFSLDAHLFEKLARQSLRQPAGASQPPKPDHLRTLGIRMALVLGALDVLASGWNDHGADEGGAPLPLCWALKLDGNDWPGCSAAIFHTSELWLEVVPDEGHNISKLASGGEVVVVTDRSVGAGIDRRLHWEIVAFDPEVDDIIAEINRKEGIEREKLAEELSSALQQRVATRRDVLGLTPNVEEQATASPRPPATPNGAKVTTPGKVADAVLRINKATPPGTKPPAYLTPDRLGSGRRSTMFGQSIDNSGHKAPAPSVEAPALDDDAAAAGAPGAPEVKRLAPPSPSEGKLASPPAVAPTAPAPAQRQPDESDEVQADSFVPCMCSRSPGKPNVLCSAIPECFKGIF